jgi:hypothetical protein
LYPKSFGGFYRLQSGAAHPLRIKPSDGCSGTSPRRLWATACSVGEKVSGEKVSGTFFAAMMRHVAHFCVAVLAESDAETTPMRHHFGPNDGRIAVTEKKARPRRPLAVAHRCTEVAHAVRSLRCSPRCGACHGGNPLPLCSLGGRRLSTIRDAYKPRLTTP